MSEGSAASSTPIFQLRGVTQERRGAVLLRNVSVELPRTAVTALIGPSGAGKTSLLRLLNRLDDPASGDVWFAGKRIESYPVRALRRRVGFVFQRAAMFPGSVADNLQAAVSLGAAVAGERAPDPALMLEAVGLGPEYAAREAAQLSGGEQQRVSIARALMTRPEVLLLDEPTSALDPELAGHLLSTIERLSRERELSVVMVTHRLGEARSVSTYTVMLEAGQVVEAGETERIFNGAANARTRAYLAAELE
jgi:putative ABC transport system ATP-binding protein